VVETIEIRRSLASPSVKPMNQAFRTRSTNAPSRAISPP
jgi:hypothetical protein